jgi:protein disulfide-isomerase A6
VNCDEDANKQLCGSMGVQGFPTLKIVKPGKKAGKPVVEDYQGARTAKAITDAVVEKIPNHVKRVSDKDLEAFLAESNDTAKAILFTEKGTTSALLKSLAIDFLGSIKVAQIRNTQAASVELFSITSFPTLLLLPGGPEAEGIVYDGEMKKEAMVAFLSKIATPNPDPAPPKVKMPKKDKKKDEKKKDAQAKESFESASSSHASAEGTAAAASATDETLESADLPTESPDPQVEKADPIVLQEAPPPIPSKSSAEDLSNTCLTSRTSTCIFAFVPAPDAENADVGLALTALAEIVHKHTQAQRKLFPFFVLEDASELTPGLKDKLDLQKAVEIVAVNGRRGWWKRFDGSLGKEALENWIDGVRLGEGEKLKLPEGVVKEEIVEEHDEL